MCGLGGIARLGPGRGLRPGEEQVLHRMVATLAHRGDDESNVVVRGQVGMAFTRLSLVGVDSGNQPLCSADDDIAVMANGEVYNHRELAATLPGYRPRTQSDCDVLVPLYQAHGTDFLDDVRAILATVVHDAGRQRLVLAVDPFANKPLFYAVVGDLLVFGSEIKALFDHPDVPRGIDWERSLLDQAFSSFPAMTHGPVDPWFAGVTKVEAGTVVTVDLATGRTTVSRYWSPELTAPSPAADPSDVPALVERYRENLFRSVEDSLMSEVGLGLFLSGGIDSAAIAAIARDLGAPLRTFTIATEATVLNGDVAAAAAVARHLGVENTVGVLDEHDVPSVDDWTALLWLMESPLAGPEQYYKYSLHRIAKLHCPDLKAMLLGAGADEFNGGYSRLLGRGAGWDAFERQLAPLAAAGDGPAARWWRSGPSGRLLTDAALAGAGAHAGDPYAAYVSWKYRDVQQYNCWMEDRCAAGNAIEARVPFLDRGLVDAGLQIPRAARAELLWDKRMAREAVRGLLPDELVFREKKPFYDGRTARFAHRTVRAMLRQDGGALVERALGGPRMGAWVDADRLRATLAADGGDGVHAEFLLHVVNLGLLDDLVAQPPAPFTPDQVTLRARPVAPDRLAEAFAALVPGADTVLALGADTVLAQDAASPGRWLLVDRHRVVFTIDATRFPDWVAFLREVDGHRTAGEIAAGLGTAWDAHLDFLELCLEGGQLRVVGTGARTPVGAGRD